MQRTNNKRHFTSSYPLLTDEHLLVHNYSDKNSTAHLRDYKLTVTDYSLSLISQQIALIAWIA